MPLPDEWQPETLSISKLRDEAEAQLVSRIHARLAATLGRSIDTAAPESLRADPGANAINAALRLSFKPATKDGNPISVLLPFETEHRVQ